MMKTGVSVNVSSWPSQNRGHGPAAMPSEPRSHLLLTLFPWTELDLLGTLLPPALRVPPGAPCLRLCPPQASTSLSYFN